MRRLSAKQKARLLRTQARRARQARRRKGATRKDPRRERRINGRILVSVGEKFSFYEKDQYEVAANLITRVNELITQEDHRVLIDFRSCNRVSAAAVLCLHAHIETWQALSGKGDVVRIIKGGTPQVQRVLKATGIGGQSVQLPRDANLLPIRTGTTAEGQLNSIVRDIDQTFYGGRLDSNLHDKAMLHGAINEAMLNVINHAYGASTEDLTAKLGKRWWVMGEVVEGQLFLAFYDKGVGIPETLPKHGGWKQIRLIFDRLKGSGPDSDLIAAAMEYGESRFKQSGRGTGLWEVLGFVRNNPDGELWVFSNCGLYRYNQISGRVHREEHQASINGTLIQWNVSIQKP